MIESVHHISVLISSEKSLDFYKLLGFTECFRKERKNDTVVLLDGYGIQLEIFLDERHPVRVVDVSEPLGPRHFALKVDNVESEMNRIEELLQIKLKFDPKFEDISSDWTGEKYVFFKDPDGNIVELHE